MGKWSDWFKSSDSDEETKIRDSQDPNDGSHRLEKLTRDSPESNVHSHDIIKISTTGEVKTIHSSDHKDKK